VNTVLILSVSGDNLCYGYPPVIELLGSPEMQRDILPRLIRYGRLLELSSWFFIPFLKSRPICSIYLWSVDDRSELSQLVITIKLNRNQRPGGSDVSQTETIAIPTGDNHAFGPRYKLDGFKWFSSATDGDMAVALARTGSPQDGSRALSLFLVPLRLPLLREHSSSKPSPIENGIYLHRLKSKIGTHAVPTAELSLQSSEAYLIGPLNQGVKSVIPILNITRVYSSVASVGHIRKCLSIATSYAKVRAIEGGTKLLKDTPLHVAQLASVSLVYRALVHLTFGVIRLLGKTECGVSSTEEACRLRILTPVVKAFAAEKACAAMEEAMTLLVQSILCPYPFCC
jgi:alkylation response protein AidB-like acyl-CoA dehydrogenase